MNEILLSIILVVLTIWLTLITWSNTFITNDTNYTSDMNDADIVMTRC